MVWMKNSSIYRLYYMKWYLILNLLLSLVISVISLSCSDLCWGIACVRYIGIIWKEDKPSRQFSRLIAYSGVRKPALNDDVCLFYYPIILRLFSIMIFSFYCRRPFGVLHLQPWLCDLLFCGVLLFAVYCHSAGLRPHLRLPQDEAEEDHFWTGQWKGAARLHPTIRGESVSFISFF